MASRPNTTLDTSNPVVWEFMLSCPPNQLGAFNDKRVTAEIGAQHWNSGVTLLRAAAIAAHLQHGGVEEPDFRLRLNCTTLQFDCMGKLHWRRIQFNYRAKRHG